MANITVMLAPAGAGKTAAALARLAELRRGRALLLLPSQLHVRRLSPQIVKLRASPYTFDRLASLALRRAAIDVPLITPLLRAALVRNVLHELVIAGQLPLIGGVAHKPGYVAAVGALITELCEAECAPAALAAAGIGPYDAELAAAYAAYLARLDQLGLADGPRRLALARDALRARPGLLARELLVVDGFDQFTPLQLSLLREVAAQAGQTLITLTGEQRERPAHRRFRRTLAQLSAALSPIIGQLDQQANWVNPALHHAERTLFELDRPTPLDAGQALIMIGAADREREVRAALRRARLLMVQGTPAEQIAILYRDGATYTPLLREVGEEYSLPLALYEGRSLAEAPPIVALLNALSLHSTGYPRRALVECWRDLAAWPTSSDTVSVPTLDPAQAARLLDRTARLIGISGGAARLHSALNSPAAADPPSELDGPAIAVLTPAQASQLQVALHAFVNWLEPPSHETRARYVAWLIKRFFPPDRAWPFTIDPIIAAALRRTLHDLAQADQLLTQASVSYEHFSADLGAALVAARYGAEEPAQGAIAVLPLLAARGASFAHVIILGASEGELPARLPEPPLYSRRERAALASKGVILPIADPADEQSIFYEAVAHARESLTLTRTRLDERGNPLAASPYQLALSALFTPTSISAYEIRAGSSPSLADAASLQEQLIALIEEKYRPDVKGAVLIPVDFALSVPQGLDRDLLAHVERGLAVEQQREGLAPYGPFEGVIDDPALLAELAQRLGPTHRWSVTQINDYTICPFRFAAAHLLGLAALSEPEEGLEQVGRGLIAHAILANAAERWSQAGLLFNTHHESAILADLSAAASELLGAAPARYGFDPGPLWAWEQADTSRRLERAVRRALRDSPTDSTARPVAFEASFGLRRGAPPLRVDTPVGPALLAGRIDRIDEDDQQRLTLIDYKSSSAPRSLDETLNGRDVQLAVYMLAAEQQIAPGQFVEQAHFLHLGSGKPSRPLTAAGREQAVSALRERLATAIVGGQAGHFAVAPSDECPPACAYAAICRLNLRKRQREDPR